MKVRVFNILFSSLLGAMGCAILQESAPVEISASRLTCKENPEMVDGDLKTVGTFTPKGTIRKGFERAGSVFRRQQYQRQYQRRVEGSLRTETLIKLDVPTYIAYVEIYPASIIRNLVLDTTTEVKPPKRALSFEAIEDKRGQKIEGTQPVRFQIGREILYLWLSANALEDRDNVSHDDEDQEMQIPLKGAAISEVKFYGR
ncbi:MAG: hypothetical protein OXU36_12885 [Candidatus Poribacteria bacterium]|nr:hypothetical protein [Candidatus Poribacteria bacterium]